MALIDNRKFNLNYEPVEKFEAGIELLGHEVKSLRAKHGSLEGSRVLVRGNEAFIVGLTIPPYQAKNTPESYEPDRTRKLLLHKSEIASLAGAESRKGLTIVPISVYNKGSNLKLRIAVARGRKQYDKRAVLKERDSKREINRTLKNR